MSVVLPPSPIDPHAKVWDRYVETALLRVTQGGNFPRRIDIHVLWRNLVDYREPHCATSKELKERVQINDLGAISSAVSVITKSEE